MSQLAPSSAIGFDQLFEHQLQRGIVLHGQLPVGFHREAVAELDDSAEEEGQITVVEERAAEGLGSTPAPAGQPPDGESVLAAGTASGREQLPSTWITAGSSGSASSAVSTSATVVAPGRFELEGADITLPT